jgi:hypothetical protein
MSRYQPDRELPGRDLALWLGEDRGEMGRTLTPFEESLALFGESARLWAAEREAARPAGLVRLSTESSTRRKGSGYAGAHLWLWSAALAMLLLMLGLPMWRHQEQAARQRELASDSVLLQQVDEDVSQVVPDALAPLGQSETSSELDSTVQAK